MKKVTPWYYRGTFTLVLTSMEHSRFAPGDGVWKSGRRVRVLNGKIRYSDVGYEFRTRGGIPFYFAPHLIEKIQTRWCSLTWYKQERGHRRVCGRCGGAGRLFRPAKAKLLTYVQCTSCGGSGRTGYVQSNNE